MLSADLAGPVSLTPRWGLAPTPIELPGSALCHLLALPARMAGLLPSSDARNGRSLAKAVAGLAAPHMLFLGATGLGKSTSLVHLGGNAMADGEVVVAVDTHDGEMLERLAASAHQDGRPVLHVVFGTSGGPVVDITEPPQGISAELWIEHMWSLIRYDVWGTMPDDYFGPVGEKAIRGLLRLSVISREFGLADTSRLIDPEEVAYREGVLRRAADRDVTRVITREIMPMIKGGDNASLFVAGKFAPFDSAMFREATAGSGPRVPLESALERGVSVLVHAPASTLGDIPARTLIAAVLRRVWVHLTSRDGGPRINIILDEWQRYASGVADTMLTESRKYGGRMILANQVLTQLSDGLRNTVLGNTGAIGCFRMSPQDAITMDGLFPAIRTYQLQTLPSHTIALTTFEHDEVVKGPAPFEQLLPAGPLSDQLVEMGLASDPLRRQLLGTIASGFGALLAARSAECAESGHAGALDTGGQGVDAGAAVIDLDGVGCAQASDDDADEGTLTDTLRAIAGTLFPAGMFGDDGDGDEASSTSGRTVSVQGSGDASHIPGFRDSIQRFRDALDRIEGTSGIDIGGLGVVRFQYSGRQMYIDVFPDDPGYLRIIAQVGPSVDEPRSEALLQLCAEVNKARAVKAIATKQGLLLSIEEFIGLRDQLPPLDILADTLTSALPQLSGRAEEAQKLLEGSRSERVSTTQSDTEETQQ